MTNYIEMLEKPRYGFERDEALRLAETLRNKTTIENGVIRYNSNGQVPPAECVALAIHIGLPVNVEACGTAREIELDAFLAEYRKNYKDPTAEERFEARAAHGPGVKLVNVLTGTEFTT